MKSRMAVQLLWYQILIKEISNYYPNVLFQKRNNLMKRTCLMTKWFCIQIIRKICFTKKPNLDLQNFQSNDNNYKISSSVNSSKKFFGLKNVDGSWSKFKSNFDGLKSERKLLRYFSYDCSYCNDKNHLARDCIIWNIKKILKK